MSSGVGVHPSCLDDFQALKLGKKSRYIIFTLSPDHTQIVTEKTGESTDYEEFLSNLPETECRWAVYDFEFEKEGAGKRNKLCFIMWSPDDAKIKNKMLFASSKDALRKSLVGIAIDVQGTELSEVSYDSVLEKANKGF